MNIIKTVPAALVPLGRLSVQPVKKNKTHILKTKKCSHIAVFVRHRGRCRV